MGGFGVAIALVACILAAFAGWWYGIHHTGSNTPATSSALVDLTNASQQASLLVLSSQDDLPEGYLSVDEALKAAGFEPQGNLVYRATVQGVDVEVRWDVEHLLCYKNEYQFNLAGDRVIHAEGTLYAQQSLLEQLLTCKLSQDANGAVQVATVDYASSPWWEGRLIAHAGGGYRFDNIVDKWNNSLDALVQNYSLGHRVFEFDFTLTSDDKLACVHDWTQFGTYDGVAHTAEEWKNNFGASRNHPENGLRTMTLDDLLDQMLVNPDMFVVTDTKSYELTNEETRHQFEVLCNTVQARDPALLDRFIVQIYTMDMYDVIMDVYPFAHVIYTSYAIIQPEDEVVDFVVSHDNVDVLASNIEQERFTPEQIKRIHTAGKKWFRHTINDYSDFSRFSGEGMDGAYTDVLLPRDIQLLANISEDRLF